MPLPEGAHHFELSEGELITVGNAGARHERVKAKMVKALLKWAGDSRDVYVFSETMFSLGPNTARIPDVSIVLDLKAKQLPTDDVAIPFAPDLAAEIVSPFESASDAEKKVSEYLAAGVQEVWQVFPAQRLIRVHHSGSIRDFTENEKITSSLLSGFTEPVEQFFLNLS